MRLYFVRVPRSSYILRRLVRVPLINKTGSFLNFQHRLNRCHQTNLIATASGDNSISIFKEDSLSGDAAQPSFSLYARTLNAHEQDVNAVAWNPKHPGLLVSCSDDSTIKMWKILLNNDHS